jgi:UDP-N-acetylglucosamine--N-acetylmuramyl-(pentapeptide) pyrophosphoryl-undecaprenol N-acetylglucosamine transferase
VETIQDLYDNREKYIENMSKSNLHSATNTIVEIIKEEMRKD